MLDGRCCDECIGNEQAMTEPVLPQEFDARFGYRFIDFQDHEAMQKMFQRPQFPFIPAANH